VKQYFGFDVSMEETCVCVLDSAGMIVEGMRLRPKALIKLLHETAPQAERIALATGSLPSWLWRELRAWGLPAADLGARRTQAAWVDARQQDRSERRQMVWLSWSARISIGRPTLRTWRADRSEPYSPPAPSW